MSSYLKLDVTRVQTLSRCGLAYDYRYNLGVGSAGGGYSTAAFFLRGKALDEGTQALFTSNRQGERLSEEAFISIVMQAFHREMANPDVRHDIPVEVGEANTLAAAYNFYQMFAHLTPRGYGDVQKWVDKFIDGDIRVGGYIDLIADEPRIIDVKFYGKPPEGDSADRNFQLGTYALLTGIRQTGLAVATHEGAYYLAGEVSDRQLDLTLNIYRRAAKAIRAGAFLPALPDSLWCSEKLCNYWQNCPHGGRTDGWRQ